MQHLTFENGKYFLIESQNLKPKEVAVLYTNNSMVHCNRDDISIVINSHLSYKPSIVSNYKGYFSEHNFQIPHLNQQ